MKTLTSALSAAFSSSILIGCGQVVNVILYRSLKPNLLYLRIQPNSSSLAAAYLTRLMLRSDSTIRPRLPRSHSMPTEGISVSPWPVQYVLCVESVRYKHRIHIYLADVANGKQPHRLCGNIPSALFVTLGNFSLNKRDGACPFTRLGKCLDLDAIHLH